MRAYNAASEEAVHTRDLLKDWAGEKFITAEQYKQMEQETVCDLKRTNIFLRVVLGLFTAIIVGAAVGLFFVMFLERADRTTTGVFVLIFAGASYAAAEYAVSQARLFRYGIEEAFLACSVILLCLGLEAFYETVGQGLVPTTGAIASIWIWQRFGLPYAPLVAMLFVPWMASEWTSSQMGRHLIVAGLYAVGLCVVLAIRPRHRFTFQDEEYSTAEAFLWLGIYVAVNLQLSSLELLRSWLGGEPRPTDFSRPFYWSTYVLIWCLPPVVLTMGLRKKDRLVLTIGGITAILTLATNKPYLGWARHTWDPMLLGALLIGVALFIRRWLAQGADEVRNGFTARRLSGKDKRWMSVGATAVGLVAPGMITPAPQEHGPEFGGGASGGGGASSDF